jgi:2-dehydro-3-deoxyglucarate aldolase
LVAMVEHIRAVDNLDAILKVEGLDAILIGPYDLSASMGLTEKFEHPDFQVAMERIRLLSDKQKIPCGVHVVSPSEEELQKRIKQGYRFLAYSIDAVMLNHVAVIKIP